MRVKQLPNEGKTVLYWQKIRRPATSVSDVEYESRLNFGTSKARLPSLTLQSFAILKFDLMNQIFTRNFHSVWHFQNSHTQTSGRHQKYSLIWDYPSPCFLFCFLGCMVNIDIRCMLVEKHPRLLLIHFTPLSEWNANLSHGTNQLLAPFCEVLERFLFINKYMTETDLSMWFDLVLHFIRKSRIGLHRHGERVIHCRKGSVLAFRHTRIVTCR